MDYIQCTKCGETIKPLERHNCPIADDAVLGDDRHDTVVVISVDIDCLTYELFNNLLDYLVKQGYSVTAKDRYKIKAEKYVPIFA